MSTCDFITADIRADLCRICPTPCEHQFNAAWHNEACARCMLNRWGFYGQCAATAPSMPPPVATAPAPSVAPKKTTLLKLVRIYRNSGNTLLAGTARRARRDACAACPHHTDTGHKGLYGCARCSVCGGQTDKLRMVRAWMKCNDGRWTTAQP